MSQILEMPATEEKAELPRATAAARPALSSSGEEFHHGPAEIPMRVLLRHNKTGRFFCAENCWTTDSSQARDFHTGWWATSVAFSMDAQNLAVIYDFDDEQYNITVPVACPSKARRSAKRRSFA
jgi:hypothetical protein